MKELNLIGLEKALKLFDADKYLHILQKALPKFAGMVENRVGIQAQADVYSYKPKTNQYTRTGRLLGGRKGVGSSARPKRTVIDVNTIKIEANPMLKGASLNYAPIVNDGYNGTFTVKAHTRGGKSISAHTRTAKMQPRPFWDNSVKWAGKQGIKSINKQIIKEIDSYKNSL